MIHGFLGLLLSVHTISEDGTGPPCDILAKLAESDPVFESSDPKIGNKTYTYHETRHGKRQKFIQPEKEIILRVLHLDSCKTEVIKIVKKGSIPESPAGWHIQVEVRPNGIQWNGYNSQFEIEEPENVLVLANNIPDAKRIIYRNRTKSHNKNISSVRWEKTENRVYSPYTRAGHLPRIVSAGDSGLRESISRAFSLLRSKHVYSQAFRDKLVADLFSPDEFYRLALDEHMDFGEFSINDAWKQWSAERVLVIFALNGKRTNIYNCNSRGACGMFQFTDRGGRKKIKGKWVRLPGTYSSLVKRYPAANLNPDFMSGAQDHINIIQAAILHHDAVLNELVSKYGLDIKGNPCLDEILAIRYNSSSRYTSAAVAAALLKNDSNWARLLKKGETREYLEKYRFLKTFIPNGAPLPSEEESQ